MPGDFRSSRFWQAWAIVGMVVLTAAFWWAMTTVALADITAWSGSPLGQVVRGIYRFTILIATPALVIAWLAAPLFRRRGLTRIGWQMLGLVAAIWAGCVLVVLVVPR